MPLVTEALFHLMMPDSQTAKQRTRSIDHQTISDTFSSPLFMSENQNPRRIRKKEKEERLQAQDEILQKEGCK
jgi:hypothetical protein